MGWPMRQGERYNHEVTLLASYNLEMDRLSKKASKEDLRLIEKTRKELQAQEDFAGTGKQITEQEARETYAAMTAANINERTNGTSSAAAAARISQSELGKLFYMYKRYSIGVHYLMFKAAKDGFAQAGLTPEEQRIARRQFAGIAGMTALMAGVGGLPFFGMLGLLYSMFCDDDDDDLDTATRKYFGDFFYKGPVEYMTNLAVGSRLSPGDLIVRDLKPGDASATFQDRMLQLVGGPAYGVEERLRRGINKMNEGNFERGLEDVLPSFASNIIKAGRYASQGTTTLRGDPITGDVNSWNVLAQAFGFAPADYTRQVEINMREKGIDKYVNEQNTKFKRKWNMARTLGDTDGMNEARNQLLELGEKHPGLGISSGTISKKLEASKKQYDKATKSMVHGVQYSKGMLKEIKQDMSEYDGE